MAWSLTHAKLHTLLRQRILLPARSHILMAVSGGQDSLCLARLLIDLQPKWHWRLGLVHCDHQWRADSADNAEHVMKLAKEWGVLSWMERAATPPKSEAAARDWRYTTFSKIAGEQGFGYVVTGHTMSDRAETILYNLMRGTGTDGLGTLPWSRLLQHMPTTTHRTEQSTLQLVRPLLNMSRQETGDFCKHHQLPVWEDSSNHDVSFRRNRIRQELVPYLQRHFNPQVEQSLAQLAEITTAETAYLAEQSETLFRESVTKRTEACWEIECDRIKKAPLALQRRVMRQVLQHAIAQPINFLHVEKLMALLDAPNGSNSDPFPGGWSAQVSKPHILLKLN